MDNDSELIACTPHPVDPDGFKQRAALPYGLSTQHIYQAMNAFVDFLGFINQQLHTKGLGRLESLLMPANFSSIVGELMGATIPRYCPSLVRNQYHNDHPDLIPVGRFPNNAVQHTDDGIEIKASRYSQGWQGHNPENAWLKVFVFDSNRPNDDAKGVKPKPFRFSEVLGARLTKEDCLFSGRSESNRRTITASVTRSGYEKMVANRIYKAPDLTSDR